MENEETEGMMRTKRIERWKRTKRWRDFSKAICCMLVAFGKLGLEDGKVKSDWSERSDGRDEENEAKLNQHCFPVI